MTHPLIEQISTDLRVSIEEVNAVIAGERLASDENLVRILHALGANGRGVYVLAIWKGTASLNTLRNTPNYGFFGQILEALNLYVDKRGYTSRLMVSSTSLVDYDHFAEIITRHPDAGLINLAANFTGDLQRACQVYQRPILYLDFPTDEATTDQYIIGVHSKSVMAAVVEQLYQLGHRRIAFIKGLQDKVSAVERFEGYKAGLIQVGLDYDATLVEAGDWHPESGEAAAGRLLALQNRPTAIIASNDQMAFGAMKVVQNHGLCIPHDVSVVGYDDIAATEMATPPLSSVRMPMSEMGAKAGEYIIDLLEGRSPEPKYIFFPLEIMLRESVGPAPVSVVSPEIPALDQKAKDT